jgi:hypothetical protein
MTSPIKNPIPITLINALNSRAAQIPTAFDICPFTSWPRPGIKKENSAGTPCVLL